ncbi:MAG: protein-disulfide reductase DsbD domain-containing protein [bacterium]
MRKQLVFICLILSVIIFTPGFCEASAGGEVEYIGSKEFELQSGSQETVKLDFRLSEDWYVNSNPAAADFLIPVTLEAASEELQLQQVDYPPGEKVAVDFIEEPLTVYRDDFTVTARLQAAGLAPGTHQFPFTLEYQPCRRNICSAPDRLEFTLTAQITPSEEYAANTDWNRIIFYTAAIAGLVLIATTLKSLYNQLKSS